MFTNVSMTASGVVSLGIAQVLTWTGVPFADTQLSDAVQGLFYLVGLAWVVFGTMRRKDLVGGFFRK